MNSTDVCVVGGGPAGMVLALLVARAGASVVVLEKHSDFLRDFRGDTVHASTLTLLDELGLGERFARLPHRRVDRARVEFGAGVAQLADLSRLPGRHQHIALVPQWDLLDLLAAAGAEEPTYRLRRDAEVTGLVYDGRRVAGVRFTDRADGTLNTLSARVVVACDGRDSAVRRAAGLVPRRFGVPIDVEWFRLQRTSSDPSGLVGRIARGEFVVMIDRGDSWQCGYVVRKGGDAALRALPVSALGDRLTSLLPWLGDRVGALVDWDDVKLLSVSLDRLRRWSADGLLLIGDAAHAMSPVGGVGINLAVQDAVAAGRVLGGAYRSGRSPDRAVLARVQRRRAAPTVVVQTFQRMAHRLIVGRVVAADENGPAAGPAGPTPGRLPLPVRLLGWSPRLQGIPARMVAIGPLPEHAPPWARRPPG